MLWAVAVPLDLEPMEVSLVEHLPEGDWQYEPKWDGFRCLARSHRSSYRRSLPHSSPTCRSLESPRLTAVT